MSMELELKSKSNFVVAISLIMLLAFTAEANHQSGKNVYDIRKYGANHHSDISKALENAWKDACGSTDPKTVLVPEGIYKLSEIRLQGPCKSPIEFRVQGTLMAPKNPKGNTWVYFSYIDRLTLSGGGVFDGQGKTSWKLNDCNRNSSCIRPPVGLRFNFITNSIVKNITSLNSKNFHIHVFGCNNLTFTNMNITAPENSPNTDGIHIGRSTGVNITNANIGTGDDCVSIGDGTKNITVNKVTCGPGHGISIGSLGKYPNEEPVEGVTIQNCKLVNTSNGVRIKTWPSSPSAGNVSNMKFEDIEMVNVNNPIIIDQEYCPWNHCNLKTPSKVKISKVSFKNITGTSATPMAIKLICSKGFPCESVEIRDIDLAYTGRRGHITSQCANVKPTISGKHRPRACS